ITRHRSACSVAGYSSAAIPSDDPVPRRSTRATAYPYSPHNRSYSGRDDAVASSLRYGSASSTTGAGRPSSAPPGRNRLTASRTPSSIGIQLRRSPIPGFSREVRVKATTRRSVLAVERDEAVFLGEFREVPAVEGEQRQPALDAAGRDPAVVERPRPPASLRPGGYFGPG